MNDLIVEDEPRPWRRALAVEFVRLMLAAIAIALALAAFLPTRTPPSFAWPALPAGWSAADWPYLRDQFDAGLAARCSGPGCAAPIEITIRPKRGFCDCERGVYDDAQLRDMGDLGLAGAAYQPLGPGEPVRLGGLDGRARAHAAPDGALALSAALHRGCDVVVIVARGPADSPAAREAMNFLRDPAVAAWLPTLLDQPARR